MSWMSTFEVNNNNPIEVTKQFQRKQTYKQPLAEANRKRKEHVEKRRDTKKQLAAIAKRNKAKAAVGKEEEASSQEEGRG